MEHKDFSGQWNYSIWYMSLNLSKSIKYTTPRVNPNVHCGLWVTMICQCRLISCNKCITPVENVDIKGGYACVCVLGGWGGGNGKSLYLSINFAVHLKLLLRKALNNIVIQMIFFNLIVDIWITILLRAFLKSSFRCCPIRTINLCLSLGAGEGDNLAWTYIHYQM